MIVVRIQITKPSVQIRAGQPFHSEENKKIIRKAGKQESGLTTDGRGLTRMQISKPFAQIRAGQPFGAEETKKINQEGRKAGIRVYHGWTRMNTDANFKTIRSNSGRAAIRHSSGQDFSYYGSSF
jgi:hypothetical protein